MSDPLYAFGVILALLGALLIAGAGVALVLLWVEWARERFTKAEDERQSVYSTCPHCRLDRKPNCYDEVE